MYQHLTDWETHAENMQISVCFCKTCICLKNLENIQISVNMINRLDITDEYSVKCGFILNTVTFIDAALNVSLRKLGNCNAVVILSRFPVKKVIVTSGRDIALKRHRDV